MKHSANAAIGLAVGLLLKTQAQAITADAPVNPYAGIVDRNVFALKPKPVPPPVATTPEVPPQKIVLQGIVNAFGRKQVLWKTTMPPAKAGEAAKEKSFMSIEGEREGEIEILEINDLEGTIKVMNNGKPQSLSLKDDGLKPVGGPSVVPGAPLGMPGIPGVPGVPVVPRNAGIQAPGGSAVTTFGGGAAVSVQRPLRVAPTTAAGYNAATAVPSGFPAQNVNKPAEPSMSAEEQAVMLEINSKLNADKISRGDLPPLPPGFVPGQ